MKKKITKAVIAAAGYGTRFIPATKNQPKEMLPIIDKPIIHYLVEEAVKSGIKDIILVTRSGQSSLEDYFDSNRELEHELQKSGKTKRLEEIKKIPKMANFIYVRQRGDLPYGNATPLLSAAPIIDKEESFVYMFGDDLTISKTPVVKQLINVYEKYNADAVLGVQKVSRKEVHKYGTVRYKKKAEYKYEIEEACEKFPAEKAPSLMAVFGRYVFSYKVVEEAIKTPLGKDNELWVTDILNSLAKKGKKIIAQPIEGEWHTTGDPLNYLKTSFKMALGREDIKSELKKYLKENL
jgi:UTP--glucose-1-phosphate uridylyltransferase